MKSKNELINEDLEVLDFKSNTQNGIQLPNGVESTDPTEAYGINCGVKTKEELLGQVPIMCYTEAYKTQ